MATLLLVLAGGCGNSSVRVVSGGTTGAGGGSGTSTSSVSASTSSVSSGAGGAGGGSCPATLEDMCVRDASQDGTCTAYHLPPEYFWCPRLSSTPRACVVSPLGSLQDEWCCPASAFGGPTYAPGWVVVAPTSSPPPDGCTYEPALDSACVAQGLPGHGARCVPEVVAPCVPSTYDELGCDISTETGWKTRGCCP